MTLAGAAPAVVSYAAVTIFKRAIRGCARVPWHISWQLCWYIKSCPQGNQVVQGTGVTHTRGRTGLILEGNTFPLQRKRLKNLTSPGNRARVWRAAGAVLLRWFLGITLLAARRTGNDIM